MALQGTVNLTKGVNRLLSALQPAELAHIEPYLRHVTLAAGQVLFDPGDDIQTTYFPFYHTMVSLLVLTTGGDEIEAATIGREGAVGGIVSAGHKPAFGRAMTQIGGHAFAIATSRLEEAKNRSPRIGDVFSRYADALLAQVMQSAACNALHTVEQRCSRWLLASNDRAGSETYRLTQEMLAQMLGVQRTTVTAVASALQARGLIQYHRGQVRVVDRAGLEAAACGCYDAIEGHYHRLLGGD